MNWTTTPHSLKQTYTRLWVVRWLSENCLGFLLQPVGVFITALFMPQPPIQFAMGASIALVFLRGPAVLTGIGLGQWTAYTLTGLNPWLAAYHAIVFTAHTWLLLSICRQLRQPTLIFYRSTPLLKFMLACSTSTSLYSLCILLIQSTMTLTTWMHIFLCQYNGILVISTAILAWDYYYPDWVSRKQHLTYLEWIVFGLLLMIIVLQIVTNHLPYIITIGLMLILIQIISHLYGYRGSVIAVVLIGFTLLAGTLFGDGATSSHTALMIAIYSSYALITGALSQFRFRNHLSIRDGMLQEARH